MWLSVHLYICISLHNSSCIMFYTYVTIECKSSQNCKNAKKEAVMVSFTMKEKHELATIQMFKPALEP